MFTEEAFTANCHVINQNYIKNRKTFELFEL